MSVEKAGNVSALQLDGSSTVAWADAPSGAVDALVVLGQDDAGAGAIQVGVARLSGRPTKGMLDDLWKSRGTRAPMGFIVAAVTPDGVWIHYPSAGAPPIGPVAIGQAERQLQSVLGEGNGLAAHGRIRAIQEAMSSAGADGFSNHFLFATYHLNRDVPRRPDWEFAGQKASPILPKRGADLVTALGFDAEPAGSERLLVLRTSSGPRRAVAVLLRHDEHFDQKSATYQLTPVAKALEIAGREDVPWVIALRKSTLRLYPGRDGVGVGQRGQSETYFELDLDLLAPEQAALLTLIFSAEALDANGSAQQILDGSGKYAADLGTRLRDRVYEGVVPRVALAIADQLPSLGLALDTQGLQTAYRLTMRILFRLLFQAYGEATELLPAGRNANYDANSLQAFITREIGTGPDQFSTESAAIWSDLTQVWGVIFHGNSRWEVPTYGGSLFDPATEEGALLAHVTLTDSVIGPALQELLSEETVDQTWGPVDFRSLQVREFGTIYEGLLESSLSLADQDLTVDQNGAYVPAKDDDEVIAPAGRPYFHSASGERKATGSYYTPKILVDHLIERSVEPALKAHLDRIRTLMDEGKARQAADAFFDFRVADLAMGSAHFLVAAVDKIERGMRDFLTGTEVPGVRAELTRLAEKAREALGEDSDGAKAITDGQLLRRQVARRCIYGLDINPLAVELSQLALWIHTFVPGLPMSSLDHGLVLANSLTGIGTIDEAMDALNADGLFEQIIREPLTAARDLLIDYANASEADKSEVAAGAEMLAKARDAAAPANAIFNVAVAKRLGVTIDEAWDAEQFAALAAMREVREAIDPLQPAHMPYLFPEVFLRERPGFDVLVGNPPWETVKVEEQKWWGLRSPKLRSMPQQARRAALDTIQKSRPDLVAEYRREIIRTDAYAKALRSGPFSLGAGDIDLYQVFAWRDWSLLRRGGRTGIVLPRTALSSSPLEPLRRVILNEGSFADVCFLTNNQQWIFPNVHPQYTVALSVLERGETHVVRFVGPFFSAAEFLSGAGQLAEVPADEFGSWSSTASFPLIPGSKAAEIFRLMKLQPRFDEARPDWHFRLTNELHSTNNRPLYEFDLTMREGKIPVLAGSSMNLWEPDAGDPFAYADPQRLREHLAAKFASQVRQHRSPFFGLQLEQGVLPMDRARIGFRKIARSTDTRTSIACLLPPGSAATEAVQLVVRIRGAESSEAFLLGVLSSIPFDWAARRWVEMNFNFFVMNPLPIPEYRPGSVLADRVVQVAGHLAAVDDRYRGWAEAIGVQVGTAKDEPTKSDHIAELDALVSLLYALSPDQVTYVFTTFQRGTDYSDRLARVLEYYEQWKDAA
ncbi:Eco57I restriction-modification methylase domain-containing protein [Microbacterium sp. NPDC078428]|uniref:Eco57I restriction-modification methylase domain-containing protein n=1 Tax=Microbacterium sp. NPDC078428 TaxID=3364190 RepID=UPI0037CAF33A